MSLPPKYPVLEAWISAVNLEGAVSSILGWIRRREQRYVNVCTSDIAVKCHDRPEMAAAIRGAAMATPDGMPLVWGGRLQGFDVSRVYGPDLMLAVVAATSQLTDSAGTAPGGGGGIVPRDPVAAGIAAARACGFNGTASHFFYGSRPEVLDALAERMRARFPGLRIAGCIAPPFRPLTQGEEEADVRRINESGADIVWCGLGTLKQDLWVQRMRPRLEAPVLIAVGAAFDFHAGLLRQAPRWVMRSGLEWLFRLCMEPRRLWRRYLVGNPRFVYLVLRQWITGKPVPFVRRRRMAHGAKRMGEEDGGRRSEIGGRPSAGSGSPLRGESSLAPDSRGGEVGDRAREPGAADVKSAPDDDIGLNIVVARADRPPARVNVLGVGIHALDQRGAIEGILGAAGGGQTGYITCTSVHGVIESQGDGQLRRIHNEALLTVPDGMPTVWMGHEQGFVRMGRVYGPELMLRVIEATSSRECSDRMAHGAWRMASEHVDEASDNSPANKSRRETDSAIPRSAFRVPHSPLSHFFYGSTDEVLARLTANLKKRFPGIAIAGTYAPPFRPLAEEEWPEVIDRIVDSGARLVWVGLSTPKQEFFMAEFVRRLRRRTNSHGAAGAAQGKGERGGGSASGTPEREPVGQTALRRPLGEAGSVRGSIGDAWADAPADAQNTPPPPHRRTDQETDSPTHETRSGLVLIGVGAAFDLHAGLRRDAPDWMKRAGLQWVHRLCQEPRRLWKRYLRIVPTFLWLSFCQVLGIRKYVMEGAAGEDCTGDNGGNGERNRGA